MKSVVLLVLALTATGSRSQMAYYNEMYDAEAAECQSVQGSARNCGYGTRNQNWFGSYQMGQANPYNFVSTMPYGYGSGALPLFSAPNAGGWPGTSYGPGGYMASAVVQPNYQPQMQPMPGYYGGNMNANYPPQMQVPNYAGSNNFLPAMMPPMPRF